MWILLAVFNSWRLDFSEVAGAWIRHADSLWCLDFPKVAVTRIPWVELLVVLIRGASTSSRSQARRSFKRLTRVASTSRRL